MKSLGDKLYIQPWDMEFCFGLRSSGTTESNFEKSLEDYKEIRFEIKNEDSDKINKLLIDRYWNLRKSILTEEYLDELINKYLNDLN